METAYLILNNIDHQFEYDNNVEFKTSFVPTVGSWFQIPRQAEKDLIELIFNDYRIFQDYEDYMCFGKHDCPEPYFSFEDLLFKVEEVCWIPVYGTDDSVTCCVIIEPYDDCKERISAFARERGDAPFDYYRLLKRNTFKLYGLEYSERCLQTSIGEFIIEFGRRIYSNNEYVGFLPDEIEDCTDEEIINYLETEYSKSASPA